MIYNVVSNGIKLGQAIRVMCPDGWRFFGWDSSSPVFPTRHALRKWLSDNLPDLDENTSLNTPAEWIRVKK